MKIAVFVGTFPKLSETFILNQITALIDAGHEVDIFAESDFPGEPHHSDLSRYNLLKSTHYFPSAKRSSLWHTLHKLYLRCKMAWLLSKLSVLRPETVGGSNFSWLERQVLSETAWDKAYDVVHCHFGPIGLRYLFLKDWFPNLPFVVTFHGGIDGWSDIQKETYAKLFQKADAVIANSGFTGDQLKRLDCAPEKMHCIREPFNISLFPFQEKALEINETLRILTVARLAEMKGLLYSVRAAAHVMAAYPNTQYTIVGEGPLRKDLEDEVGRLGIERKVVFAGAKTQDEIAQFYQQSHIFVLASVTSKTGIAEGQGLVLQEAQACGLPVIATRHNGFPEGLVENKSGFLVPERDDIALAERILYLADHPEDWKSMGRAGRAFVECRYDKHVVASQLVAVYEDCQRS